MANPVILVPPFTHTPERVSSATTESGLTVAAATEDTSNKGTLRLATSGTPLSSLALHVKLTSGGNARGYPGGVGFAWRNSTEADAAYRYYTDAYVLRERSVRSLTSYPGIPSTPRQTADGKVGYPVMAGATFRWHAEDAQGTPTRTQIPPAGGSSGISTTARTYDSIVLPSGRIVVFALYGANVGVKHFYSDDNGATWTLAGVVTGLNTPSGAGRTVLCAELVGDAVFLLMAKEAPTGGGDASEMYWSYDGGFTFTQVTAPNFINNPRTCVTKAGTVLLMEPNAISSYVEVHEVAPGGSPVQITTAAIGCGKRHFAIATRDDGSVWLWSVGGSLASGLDLLRMELIVSTDNGYTWSSPTPDAQTYPWDLGVSSALTSGLRYLAAAPAFGTVIFVGQLVGSGFVGQSTVTWAAGGYETVGEYDAKPYAKTYSPSDFPDTLGWTRTNFGGGATVTLDGALTIAASAAGNTRYRSAAAWWTSGTATSGKRVRMTVKATGGNTANDVLYSAFSLTDGAGFTYGCSVRFSATQAVILDSAGTTLATANYTAGWKTWIFALRISGTNLEVSAWIADANATDGTGVFTQVLSAGTSARVAGTADRMDFGGTALAFGTLEVQGIHVSEQASAITPTGRFLPSAFAVWLEDGVLVSGVNAYGMPGDVFYITTAYTYGKDNTWAEYRPSRYVQAAADGAPWRIVFDAGSGDKFSADRVALLGTNFRTARFEMNTTDSWATPALSVNLNATEQTFATFTGTTGSIAPSPAPSLRPSQFRSDGDAHRWFLEVTIGANTRVYEITDNDASRIFCEGVDFTTATGPARVFRDRMGAAFTSSTYRFASVVIDSQDTSDGAYRLGTPVFGQGYQLPQSYDYGFVDRTEANVSLTTTPAGYRAAARIGPRRHALSVQWSPVNRRDPVRGETDRALADIFAALEGSRVPFVFVRDGDQPNDCSMVRVTGTLSRTNVWGEASTALTRVDQVTLEEEL